MQFLSDNIRYLLDSILDIQISCSIFVRLFHATYSSICPLIVDHIITTLNSFFRLVFVCLMKLHMSMLVWYMGKLS